MGGGTHPLNSHGKFLPVFLRFHCQGFDLPSISSELTQSPHDRPTSDHSPFRRVSQREEVDRTMINTFM